jgi:hypothetical protein
MWFVWKSTDNGAWWQSWWNKNICMMVCKQRCGILYGTRGGSSNGRSTGTKMWRQGYMNKTTENIVRRLIRCSTSNFKLDPWSYLPLAINKMGWHPSPSSNLQWQVTRVWVVVSEKILIPVRSRHGSMGSSERAYGSNIERCESLTISVEG